MGEAAPVHQGGMRHLNLAMFFFSLRCTGVSIFLKAGLDDF